jgi:DNA-binding response OmpR family regulator
MLNGDTVFVVDDEPVIGETVAAVLNQAGYEATAFDDARLAVAAAAKSSPDLLISDVMMPGMNGVELAIHFQNFHPRCKILLFSTVATTADPLVNARLRGYDFDLLTKPLHPAKLLERIETL